MSPGHMRPSPSGRKKHIKEGTLLAAMDAWHTEFISVPQMIFPLPIFLAWAFRLGDWDLVVGGVLHV